MYSIGSLLVLSLVAINVVYSRLVLYYHAMTQVSQSESDPFDRSLPCEMVILDEEGDMGSGESNG